MSSKKADLNKSLNPWKKINDNFVECTNGVFTAFYTINPADLSSDSDSDILIKMNGLASMFKENDDNEIIMGFFSLCESFNFNDEITFYKKQTNKNAYWQKLAQLCEICFSKMSQLKFLKKHKYFLYFCAPSKKNILQLLSKITPSAFEGGLQLLPSTREDIFLVFNALFNLPQTNDTFNIKNLEIKFFREHFSIRKLDNNGEILNNKMCRILNVSQTSKSPFKPFWLDPLFNSDDLVVSVEFDSLKEKERNSFIEGLNSDFLNVRQYKSKIKNLEIENNRNTTSAIIRDISTGVQDIKLTKILIYISGENKIDFKKKYNAVRNILGKSGLYYTNINFRQQEALVNIQPFGLAKEIDKDIEIVLTTDAIGLSYPFTQTYFVDKGGVYIGTNTNGSPLLIDICDRRKRASGNVVILGTTGSRKSTLIKMLILGFFFQESVEQTLVLDWQNEYTQLAHNFDQLVLNFTKSSGDSTPHINLLQIPRTYISFQDGDAHSDIVLSTKERYQEHVQYVINALSSLLLQRSELLSTNQFFILSEQIQKIYTKFDVKNDDNHFDTLKNESWPTLDDLYQQMKEEFITKPNTKQKRPSNEVNDGVFLANALSTWCKQGVYDGIFNKHTNIAVSNQYKLIVFNMFGLKTEGSSNNIQKVMTMSVLKFFDNTMYEHRRKYPRENDPNARYKNFIVDEFHLVVDENNTAALEGFSAKYQTARKFYCNMCIATPSLSTFTQAQNRSVLRALQNILDNSVFKFFLSMSDDELQQINDKMFSSENKLSPSEINFLTHFDNENNAGKFILSISMFGRIQGQIDSGKPIKREDFNVSIDKITEFAQLWGKPPIKYSHAETYDITQLPYKKKNNQNEKQ